MILRQSAETYQRDKDAWIDEQGGAEASGFRGSRFLGLGLSLRQQLVVLTGVTVAFTILVTALVSFWAAATTITNSMDSDLRVKADALMDEVERHPVDELEGKIAAFKYFNPQIHAAVSPPQSNRYYGDAIAIGGAFHREADGEEISVRTAGGERILVLRKDDGSAVALAQQVDPSRRLQGSSGAALLVILCLGIAMAWAVASVVAATGLYPLRRLQKAVDEVTRTEELKPLPVEGDDELANISRSFNRMIQTLQDSRTRQTQLVADAGHELKTPLTSMRTNIELFMMMYKSGHQDMISPEERENLERDVLAQMEEMSTLIGDLVDLAREDSPNTEFTELRLDMILEEALDRVRRRRPDVTFQFHADPWVIMGDHFAMGRAPINLIDNAAKWSPDGGTVRISLKAATTKAVLIVDDSGPGIAPKERARVFERFYRAPESRAMPGSGLGLAIVKQVLDRHDAQIFVEESDDGGTRMRVVFPGWRPPAED